MAVGLLGASVSCTTTYDQYGKPRKTVDPGVATVGILAAGVIGYALANSDDDKEDAYNDDYGYYDDQPSYSYNRYGGYDRYERRGYGRYDRYDRRGNVCR